ncbi:MAG: hypothetical protein J7K26_03470 [Candidatus Aenigmarchaeota archaeon]|nr:hypothetical protein [Candidatus Aenigmarchaeota archaeon]
MNRPFYLYLLILQRMSKRFYNNSINPKIIPFPQVNKFLSYYHIRKKDTRIILKELKKLGLIDIIPYHGIRILNISETKELMASQLPDWYTRLMEKYEKEMGREIKV